MQSLSTCDFGPHQEATCNNNDRVSLRRGRDQTYDFIFTLSDATLNIDSGVYQIAIQAQHPATGSLTEITKTFHVVVSSFSEYILYLRLAINQMQVITMCCCHNRSNYHNFSCSRNRDLVHQKFNKQW